MWRSHSRVTGFIAGFWIAFLLLIEATAARGQEHLSLPKILWRIDLGG